MSKTLLSGLHDWADLATRQSMEQTRHFVQENGLSFAQANSLLFLDRVGETNINSLAAHLGVTKAAVSQMVDRLVESGLVNRREDARDRRSKLISLTEEGHALTTESCRARHSWIEKLVDFIPITEQARLGGAINELTDALRQLNLFENTGTPGQNIC